MENDALPEYILGYGVQDLMIASLWFSVYTNVCNLLRANVEFSLIPKIKGRHPFSTPSYFAPSLFLHFAKISLALGKQSYVDFRSFWIPGSGFSITLILRSYTKLLVVCWEWLGYVSNKSSPSSRIRPPGLQNHDAITIIDRALTCSLLIQSLHQNTHG